jgi:predicted transglutaminase-like cysteine proteinase
MITWQTALILAGVAALVPAAIFGQKLWYRFFPYSNWAPSVKVTDGANQGAIGTWYDWYQASNKALGTGGRGELVLTTRLKATIDNLSKDLNTAWSYISDAPGVDWESIDNTRKQGDCEDFARVLAMKMIDAGIPASALSFAIGPVPMGYWHAVLWLDTDQGGYVFSVGKDYQETWQGCGYISADTWVRTGAEGWFYPFKPAA